jgi:hypothetical protein
MPILLNPSSAVQNLKTLLGTATFVVIAHKRWDIENKACDELVTLAC